MSETRELSPAGSIERNEPQKDEKKQKSRRPPNTAFRQQRLKAWQPILTPKTVLPLFFAVGILFAPIGGLLLYASSKVKELTIDYTDCGSLAPETQGRGAPIPSSRVSSVFTSPTRPQDVPTWKRENIMVPYGPNNNVPTNSCTIEFQIPDTIGPPIYFYYKLTKFYQNHRRYVKSMDQNQLAGKFVSNSTVNGAQSDCSPLQLNGDGKAFYPCGTVANSLFNDTFQSPVMLNVNSGNSNNRTYEMTNKGISWSSDKDLYQPSVYKNWEVVPPPNWIKRYPGGVYSDDFPIPNFHDDEPFQVWMRTAGLPTFSKMARRNDTTSMARGRYSLTIYDDFPVSVYGGTKSILISTRTVMGGRNPFLGIAYIVVAGVCVLLGALFLVTYLIKPRKLGDHTYLSWNNEHTSNAISTGRSVRPNENA